MSNSPPVAYFGEQRDYWWHKDYVDLLAQRLELGQANSLADIGCGIGHWGMLLYQYLPPQADLVGVDISSENIHECIRIFQKVYPNATSNKARFLIGDATHLELASNQFDIVTCQTLLIQLAQPLDALAEMIRITKPGGIIACVEPDVTYNNLYFAFSSLTQSLPIQQVVGEFEYWYRYIAGRAILGKGDYRLGSMLPGYFATQRLQDIRVYLSDRTAALFPPYATREQQVLIEQDVELQQQETGPWNKDFVRQCVLATGASEAYFENGWREGQETLFAKQEAIRQQSYHAGMGSQSYIVIGRKPFSWKESIHEASVVE